VAQGREVLGRRVKPGPVLYIAAEDPHGMKGRVRALMRRYGNAPQFFMFPTSVDLTNPADLAEIKQHVESIKPALIVLDTVARAFPGLRENEAEDMSRVVSMARGLTEICGSAVVSVHHVAKDNGITPRGHGSLNGDADITILVEGTRSEVRSIKLGKNRSGPSDLTFAFQIEVEELGIDEDGDPITAPVAVEADAADARPRTARLKDTDAVLLHEARELIGEHGEQIAPERGMPFVRAVRRQALREHLIRRSWFPEDMLQTGNGEPTKLTRAGYRPENRTLTSLKNKVLLCFTREWVWLL
jgi:predicted ATP-dependent serine protease